LLADGRCGCLEDDRPEEAPLFDRRRAFDADAGRREDITFW
jgi:hypothetical protein